MGSEHLIRLDIDSPRGKQPKLIGLAINGFSWVLGGGRNGDLVISIRSDGVWEPFDSRNSQQQVDRFRRRIDRFDWSKNGRKSWPTA